MEKKQQTWILSNSQRSEGTNITAKYYYRIIGLGVNFHWDLISNVECFSLQKSEASDLYVCKSITEVANMNVNYISERDLRHKYDSKMESVSWGTSWRWLVDGLALLPQLGDGFFHGLLPLLARQHLSQHAAHVGVGLLLRRRRRRRTPLHRVSALWGHRISDSDGDQAVDELPGITLDGR